MILDDRTSRPGRYVVAVVVLVDHRRLDGTWPAATARPARARSSTRSPTRCWSSAAVGSWCSAGRFSWLPVVLIAVREIVISVFRSYWGRRGLAVPASKLAKFKTFLQLGAVGLGHAAADSPTSTWLADAPLWLGVVVGAGQRPRSTSSPARGRRPRCARLTTLRRVGPRRLEPRSRYRAAMRCEVVAIGTELLLGQIVDTNSSWIGEQLALAGIDSHFQTKVGDNLDRIVAALALALDRSDAVICCGGLGPTQDDITREAIAAGHGRRARARRGPRRPDPQMFGGRGRHMPDEQPAQASVPDGRRASSTTQPGTAPGLRRAPSRRQGHLRGARACRRRCRRW